MNSSGICVKKNLLWLVFPVIHQIVLVFAKYRVGYRVSLLLSAEQSREHCKLHHCGDIVPTILNSYVSMSQLTVYINTTSLKPPQNDQYITTYKCIVAYCVLYWCQWNCYEFCDNYPDIWTRFQRNAYVNSISYTSISTCTFLMYSKDTVLTPSSRKLESIMTRAPSQYKDRLIYVWRFPC